MSVLPTMSNEQPSNAPSLTRLAARRLRELAADEIPVDVQRKVAMCLLDYVGACIGGLSAPWAPAVLRYVNGRGAAPEAHQWGLPHPVAAEDAAFGNSALGHSLIRDDMHVRSGTHIGVLVIPAALALAQRERLSGRALVRGLVGGYEMAVRLGTAVRIGTAARHFRPSGINGAFGAASAAIAAIDVDEDTAVHALGFAANAAAGLNEWPWAGGQEICTHTGMAARGGLAAFDLACAGMCASESVLEGHDGLFNAYGAGAEGADLFAQSLHGPFGIMEVRHKPYMGCNLIQTPIAAALDVRRLMGDRADDIVEVTIKTFAQAQSYPGCDSTGPFTQVQQSKMSLQYGVASALLYGRVDDETYSNFSDPRLQHLLECCRIEIDPTFDTFLLKLMQPARIEVRLKNGDVHGASLEDVPWLGEDAVEARFRHAAATALAPAAVDRIVDLANTLWEFDDCTPLFEAFASGNRDQTGIRV